MGCCLPRMLIGLERPMVDGYPSTRHMDFYLNRNPYQTTVCWYKPPGPFPDEPVEPDSTLPLVKATHDYVARSMNDLTFRDGDRMTIIKQADPEWWLARYLKTGQVGYIPRGFVVEVDPLAAYAWYHGNITRYEAERLLLATGLTRGMYIIRSSQSLPGTLAISILDENEYEEPAVKHYRLLTLETDTDYYLTPKEPFDSVPELIEFYTEDANGLCCALYEQYPKPKQDGLDQDGNSGGLSGFFGDGIGSGQFGEIWRDRQMMGRVRLLEQHDFIPSKMEWGTKGEEPEPIRKTGHAAGNPKMSKKAQKVVAPDKYTAPQLGAGGFVPNFCDAFTGGSLLHNPEGRQLVATPRNRKFE